jgi:hypothetical protein
VARRRPRSSPANHGCLRPHSRPCTSGDSAASPSSLHQGRPRPRPPFVAKVAASRAPVTATSSPTSGAGVRALLEHAIYISLSSSMPSVPRPEPRPLLVLFSAKIVDRDSARHRSYVRLRAAMQCVLARDAHQRPSHRVPRRRRALAMHSIGPHPSPSKLHRRSDLPGLLCIDRLFATCARPKSEPCNSFLFRLQRCMLEI